MNNEKIARNMTTYEKLGYYSVHRTGEEMQLDKLSAKNN
jgi:hypothetical protein